MGSFYYMSEPHLKDVDMQKKLLQMCVFHMLVFSGYMVNTDSCLSPICLKTSVTILLNATTQDI